MEQQHPKQVAVARMVREPSKMVAARHRRRNQKTSALKMSGVTIAALTIGWFGRDVVQGLHPLFPYSSEVAVAAPIQLPTAPVAGDSNIRVLSTRLNTRSIWRDTEDHLWIYKYGSLEVAESWTIAQVQTVVGQQLEVGRAYTDSQSAIWSYLGGSVAEPASWKLLKPNDAPGSGTQRVGPQTR